MVSLGPRPQWVDLTIYVLNWFKETPIRFHIIYHFSNTELDHLVEISQWNARTYQFCFIISNSVAADDLATRIMAWCWIKQQAITLQAWRELMWFRKIALNKTRFSINYFHPSALRPKGYCCHLHPSVCLSVCLSMMLLCFVWLWYDMGCQWINGIHTLIFFRVTSLALRQS